MKISYTDILEGGRTKDIKFLDVNDFCKLLSDGKKKEIYEMIDVESYVKPYIDLDLKGKNEQVQNESLNVVIDKFLEDFDSTEDDLIYSSAHGNDVWSYHIAINNKKTKIEDMKNWFDQNKSFLSARGVDSKVYRKGKYRTILSDKKVKGEWANRPFKIEKGDDLKDHIVTYTTDDFEVIRFEKKEDIKKSAMKLEKKEKNESGIEDEIESKEKRENQKKEDFYEKQILEEIINAGYLDSYNLDYKKWIEVCFMLSNSSEDYYDLFLLFSQRCPKAYNGEENVKEQWRKCKENNYDGHKFSPKTIKKLVKRLNPSGFDLIVYNVFNRQEGKNINSYVTVNSTNDAVQFVYSHLKDVLKVSKGNLYFKQNNIWTSNEKMISSIICSVIMESSIKTITSDGSIIPYAQNYKTANEITTGLINKVRKDNNDEMLYKKFHSTTKNKLCFKNGVLDFTNGCFTEWDDLEDEIYSLVIIPYDYSDNCSPRTKENVLNFLKELFGEEQYVKVLQFTSRAIAGNVEDKDWAVFQGNRDCGKGCYDMLLRETFHDYIKNISSNVFISKQMSSGDEAKALSYLVPLEFARLVTTQECAIGNGTVIDGIKIKGFTSGGDSFQVRQNYKDEQSINIDAKLMMFQNDMPEIKPSDAYETLHIFRTFQSFKKKEWIDNRKQELEKEVSQGCSINVLGELKRYKICDDELKTKKIPSSEWHQSFIQILLDHYSAQKLTIYKPISEDPSPSLSTEIFKLFDITNKQSDIMTASKLEDVCSKIKSASKNKIKAELSNLGVSKGKDKDRRVIYLGIKEIEDIKECSI